MAALRLKKSAATVVKRQSFNTPLTTENDKQQRIIYIIHKILQARKNKKFVAYVKTLQSLLMSPETAQILLSCAIIEPMALPSTKWVVFLRYNLTSCISKTFYD